MSNFERGISVSQSIDVDDDALEELTWYCQSDSLSADGLQDVIERHGVAPNPCIDDYEFFFWACSNERATEETIQYLLEYFPGAAGAYFPLQGRANNIPPRCLHQRKYNTRHHATTH